MSFKRNATFLADLELSEVRATAHTVSCTADKVGLLAK